MSKVFISWSGDRSKALAEVLKNWIPELIQPIEIWSSEHDIDAGARWVQELNAHLEGCQNGVICLTPENLAAPWLLFEAGCLGKSVSRSRVIPYRLGLT